MNSKDPIFLSASVPERETDKYIPDPLGIAEAIRALVAEAVRERLLVFGGHPAISPLVEFAARTLNAIDNVHIYQSEHFRSRIPPVALTFPNLKWTTELGGDMKRSLTHMREEMIGAHPYAAGVFIGGMDGLYEEWDLFAALHPDVPALPVASTEGAARLLWQSWNPPSPPVVPVGVKTRLDRDLQYRHLFRDLLG